MSGALDLAAVLLAVGGASGFVAFRALRAFKGRRPACCGGSPDPGPRDAPPAPGDRPAGGSACAGCAFAGSCR